MVSSDDSVVVLTSSDLMGNCVLLVLSSILAVISSDVFTVNSSLEVMVLFSVKYS